MDTVRWACAHQLHVLALALALSACEAADVSNEDGRDSYSPDLGPDEVADPSEGSRPALADGGDVLQPSSDAGVGAQPPVPGADGGDSGEGSSGCVPTGAVETCGNALDDDCKDGVDDGCVAGKGAFQFVNGCTVFEVEAILGSTPPGDWEYRTKQPPCARAGTCSFSGDGHYVFQPGQGCGSSKASDAGLLKFPFEVTSAGMFRMAFRNLEDNATDSCEGDRNNDAFVSFPSTTSDPAFSKPFKVFHGGNGGAWDWNAEYDIAGLSPDKENVCVALPVGIHEVELRGRAANFYIDRIAICRYDNLDACREANSATYEQLPNSPRAP